MGSQRRGNANVDRQRVSRASAEEPGIGTESVPGDFLGELVFVIHYYCQFCSGEY